MTWHNRPVLAARQSKRERFGKRVGIADERALAGLRLAP
jgi:hypothetical protein